MLEKHEGWHGAMVWPHHALVKIWEGLAYVVMHALHKSNHPKEVPCFREGNHQDWRGIQIFFVLCPGVFSTTNIHPANHRVQIWHFLGSFTIFRGLCAFSRQLAHINPIQLQVHGCDVREVDCRSIAAHPMLHTRDPHGWGSGQS